MLKEDKSNPRCHKFDNRCLPGAVNVEAQGDWGTGKLPKGMGMLQIWMVIVVTMTGSFKTNAFYCMSIVLQ